MKWLQVAKAVLMLLPVLIAAIRAIEEAIPGEGKGEMKLAQIRGILEVSHKNVGDALVEFEDIWPTLLTVITNLVIVFNAVGWKKEEA